jgi:hypothetical protein
LDLLAAPLLVGLNTLAASSAGKLEFAHNVRFLIAGLRILQFND